MGVWQWLTGHHDDEHGEATEATEVRLEAAEVAGRQDAERDFARLLESGLPLSETLIRSIATRSAEDFLTTSIAQDHPDWTPEQIADLVAQLVTKS